MPMTWLPYLDFTRPDNIASSMAKQSRPSHYLVDSEQKDADKAPSIRRIMLAAIERREVVIGLDVGDVRVGVAASDPSGLIASPVGAFERAKGEAEKEILKLIHLKQIKTLVVGLPLNEQGEKTAQSIKTENFCRRLARRAAVEMIFVDEYLSSEEARDRLSVKRRRGPKQKGVIDAHSATIILQRFLNHRGR